jgi:YD repeat-containing protein
MGMEYYGPEKNGSVKSVREKDGTVTQYDYVLNNKDYYGVSIKVSGADGKLITQSEYQYYNQMLADGELWTKKLVTTVDGEKSVTVYDANCKLPALIEQGGDSSRFQYDSKCHVTLKESPTSTTQLTYDPVVGKVSSVTQKSRLNPKDQTWSQFSYDPKGNLITAKNSEGKGVRMVYDPKGRIQGMVNQEGHQVLFKYNQNSRPIEITDPKLGTITISYSNSGEIKSVDSSGGRKVASQVTQEFQELLEIIRPAGVSLSL